MENTKKTEKLVSQKEVIELLTDKRSYSTEDDLLWKIYSELIQDVRSIPCVEKQQPVSADVEQAAKELYPIPFPDKFSNMNQEAIKERLAFIAGIKYQSQQPVGVQWLSEEEIEDKYPCKNRIHPNSITHEKQQDACKWIQSQLQSRVNAVDEKQVLISFCGWLFGGLCDETEQRIVTDYLTSKTK